MDVQLGSVRYRDMYLIRNLSITQHYTRTAAFLTPSKCTWNVELSEYHAQDAIPVSPPLGYLGDLGGADSHQGARGCDCSCLLISPETHARFTARVPYPWLRNGFRKAPMRQIFGSRITCAEHAFHEACEHTQTHQGFPTAMIEDRPSRYRMPRDLAIFAYLRNWTPASRRVLKDGPVSAGA
jgi:hypothetical protein